MKKGLVLIVGPWLVSEVGTGRILNETSAVTHRTSSGQGYVMSPTLFPLSLSLFYDLLLHRFSIGVHTCPGL